VSIVVPTHMTLAVSVPTHFMSLGLSVGMLIFIVSIHFNSFSLIGAE
jgi:hypothetical protein